MSRAQVGAVIATALVGVLIGRASISSADRSDSERRTVAPSDRGAAVAAIEYLAALRWDVLVDDAARRRAIAARATPEAAGDLNAELAAGADALREAVSHRPVVARSAVLGYRVVNSRERRAVVRIWGMALFGTGAYRPTTQWSTSDLTMVWSGERWLVDGVATRGGPSLSSGTRTLARHARDLKEVRHVP